MDEELLEFCARMLADRDAAAAAADTARRSGDGDPVRALAAAVAACRSARERTPAGTARSAGAADTAERVEAIAGEPPGLAQAVAGELAAATGRLPERQREALALRELLGRPHAEVGAAIGIEPAAVAPLLARSRIRLRDELRGAGEPVPDCPERDRALRTIALRQDGEPVLEADDEWLMEHLGHCTGCRRAHSAMLEASVCYRAWRVPAATAPAS